MLVFIMVLTRDMGRSAVFIVLTLLALGGRISSLVKSLEGGPWVLAGGGLAGASLLVAELVLVKKGAVIIAGADALICNRESCAALLNSLIRGGGWAGFVGKEF